MTQSVFDANDFLITFYAWIHQFLLSLAKSLSTPNMWFGIMIDHVILEHGMSILSYSISKPVHE